MTYACGMQTNTHAQKKKEKKQNWPVERKTMLAKKHNINVQEKRVFRQKIIISFREKILHNYFW